MSLVVGASRTLQLRRERVTVGASARLVYASDLHLGRRWTRNVPALLEGLAREQAPDAILLGGDLVDHSRGARHLEDLVERLTEIAPVAAVPGNHDVRAGLGDVRSAVRSGGGFWLHDAALSVAGIQLDGRVTDVGNGAPRVLCGHDPAVWPRARAAGYTATLAGHLHGCQWVAFAARGRLYPGAWFYRWNGLRFERDGATLLVSRGAADTLPLRWNCPHEVLLVECV